MSMARNPAGSELRLAEAAGVLALATDLAMGQTLEHGLRTAILGTRIAAELGLGEHAQQTVFYTGLLHFAGCTTDGEIDSGFFGNEIVARPPMMAAFLGPRRDLMSTAMRVAHRDSPPLVRAAAMAKSAVGGIAEFRRWAREHCDVARLLGARMGLSDEVQQALGHLYERWDGRGMPGEVRGEQIPLPVRVMHVAQDADMAWQRGGPQLAARVVASRAGSGLDPGPARALLDAGEKMFADLDQPSVWDVTLDTEPGERVTVSDERLDECLSAVADFADLKSMWTVGHSRGVAGIAAQAAVASGLPDQDARHLYRAALVHDIGRVTVPVRVWAKPGPLSRHEQEQVRLHAYHSERVLDAAAALRPLARLAGSHGERCDGSGYHRGSRTADLSAAAWLLAAADCYHAMREPRPHRPAMPAATAAHALGREVREGRLPADAVHAVLAAAGQARATPVRPAGLSERECEVLALLARGLATKQIARQLGISPKTCDHHIQSVYAKAGVSSRAAATVFALENGLAVAGSQGD